MPASDGAGGYLVGPSGCSCPDAQRGTKCKHRWAVEFASDVHAGDATGAEPAPAQPKAPAWPQVPRGGDLTADERRHVQMAIRFLVKRGGWDALAKATRFQRNTLRRVAYGRPLSASLAIRLARVAGVTIDDMLQGRFPPCCPTCDRPQE